MKKGSVTIAILAVLVVLLIGVGVLYFEYPETIDDIISGVKKDELKKFSSYDELKNFVKTNIEMASYGFGYYGGGFMGPPVMAQTTTAVTGATAKAAEAAPSPVASEDYSTTTIQVAGVDEADIVKNDGKYIYVVSGKKIVIIDAYPAEEAGILSEIELDENPQEIFINKDKLVVFWSGYPKAVPYEYTGRYSSKAFIYVYDVSNRENLILKRNVSIDGSYFDSRMIGDYVYIIINQPLYYVEDDITIPKVYSENIAKSIYDYSDMYYFDMPDYSYMFVSIMAINTQNDNEDFSLKSYIMGITQNMYVSLENIFVTYTKRVDPIYIKEKMIDDVIIPSLPITIANEIRALRSSALSASEEWQRMTEIINEYSNGLSEQEKTDFQKNMQERLTDFYSEIAKQTEKTVIHKISIKDGEIKYQSNGEAPGYILNQFSMDEYNEYFRIATTTGHVARFEGEASSKNHVYVLDKNLDIVGKEEDLAPGERIYSARFIGDRCYLVTFRKIDPLFVIDLSNPYDPTVLGKLKIPGYSDYLHPYDENHIIGIGKETIAAESGDFSWYQGVKLSLFDVNDVTKPKEISKYEIGDRGTDSYALSDHKAFLFSKSKNLLVIPILLAEIDEEKYVGEIPTNVHGDYVWQGAYIFDVSLENGFIVKGMVSHADEEEFLKSGYYSPYSVKRSLYIGGVLYTVSDKMIKMNDLDDLEYINKVELPYEEEVYPYPVWR